MVAKAEVVSCADDAARATAATAVAVAAVVVTVVVVVVRLQTSRIFLLTGGRTGTRGRPCCSARTRNGRKSVDWYRNFGEKGGDEKKSANRVYVSPRNDPDQQKLLARRGTRYGGSGSMKSGRPTDLCGVRPLYRGVPHSGVEYSAGGGVPLYSFRAKFVSILPINCTCKISKYVNITTRHTRRRMYRVGGGWGT